ncbi:18485_t:CDS:2 [Acaulospora morrowiae]|uniref:18485_t:CDS:1 n=1 Tax=Acaulospora morrowiae TaxID=94023 RepID=A0A9N8V6X7_9GLOM|nr:18485_t:CDS:2 [Acaulospora morrowiae]
MSRLSFSPQCVLCPSYELTKPLDANKSFLLKECLTYVKGEVVYPESTNYLSSIANCNCRLILHPIAIVYVLDVEDVQESINCANQLDIPVVPKSGGHSYEGYSLGGRDGVLVIDVSKLNQVTVDLESQTAVVGSGNRLGPVYAKLNESGFVIPAGSCPQVGVGGQATGGGYGFLGRKYGMLSDNVIAAEIVIANGSFLSVNSTQHPDLFFALRGAGNAGYGVVTSFTMKVYPAPETVTVFNFTYATSDAQKVFDTFSTVGPTLNKNFSLYLSLFSDLIYEGNECDKNDETDKLTIHGSNFGPLDETKSLLEEFINLNPIKEPVFIEAGWWDTVIDFVGDGNETAVLHPYFYPEPFKQKSFFVDSPGLTTEGLTFLQNYINSSKCKTVVLTELYAGGRVNEISTDESAFFHRDSLYVIQLETKLKGVSQDLWEECVNAVNKFGTEFQGNYTSYHSYQLYIDKDLSDWGTRYYGYHFTKLIEIKATYDPLNRFNWAQSIPIE